MGTVDDWLPGRGNEDFLHRLPGAWHEDNRSRQLSWPFNVLPAGLTYYPIDGLKHFLGSSARWHARAAIQGFCIEDMDVQLQAATSTGSAVELLAKAYIATINPALLADKGDRDTILHLSGHSSQTRSRFTAMKSIVGYDALRLVRQLHPQFPLYGDRPAVLQVRNAALHMAMVDAWELRAAVIEMARMIESLLGLLDLDREKFWGTNVVQVVDSLLDEAARELDQILKAKLGAARSRLVSLTASLSEANAAVILAALATGRPRHAVHTTDHGEPQECPVCHQNGWMTCTVLHGKRAAHPYYFECPVCYLELERDELADFEFPRSIELEPESPEPDEAKQ